MNRIKFEIMHLIVSALHRIAFFCIKREFFLSMTIASFCQKKAFNIIQEMKFITHKIAYEKAQSRKSI